MHYFIYKITNKINGKFYIGSTTNMEKRQKRHFYALSKGKHHSLHLQNAYNLYGKECFEISCREVNVKSEVELRELEERYIKFCWSSGKLYNVSMMGSGGDLISYHPKNSEFRRRQSKLTKERYSKLTDEQREEMANNLRGDKNPNYGNRWSEEQRLKASIRLKEYYKTHGNEKKNKTYEELYGEEKAITLKKHLSEIRKGKNTGKNNPFFGKRHSAETKKMLSKLRRGKTNKSATKKVLYNGKIFSSATECANELNLPMVTIAYRCRKQIYGFSYMSDEQSPQKAKTIWTYEKCEEVAKTCKTKKELERKNANVYNWLLKNNYMDDIAKKYFTELRHKWTKDEIIDLAKNYPTYSDFRKNEKKAISAMNWNGWLNEVKSIWNK